MFVQWTLERNQSYNIEIIHSIDDHMSNFHLFFIIEKKYVNFKLRRSISLRGINCTKRKIQ